MLTSITVKGWMSFREEASVQLGPLNVLVGRNDAGKSNFLAALNEAGRAAQGGRVSAWPSRIHRGCAEATIELRDHEGLVFGVRCTSSAVETSGSGLAVGSIFSYQSATLGPAAPGRGACPWTWGALRSDASNLVARLAELRGHPGLPAFLNLIPGFDFRLVPVAAPLACLEVEDSDYALVVGEVSGAMIGDGALRILTLAAILLDPRPATTTLIDQPELGLHPDLHGAVAGLLREASTRTTLVVASHSPFLVSELEAHELLVVERGDGGSRVERAVGPGSSWLSGAIGGVRWGAP